MENRSSLEEGKELLKEQLPDLANVFEALRDEATKDGALSAKTKRLIMVAVTQRWETCIRTHVKATVEMGASRKEILEATELCIMMAGGPTMAYTSRVVLKVLDEMEA